MLSERELESRYEVWLEQYVDPRQHRGGDGARRSPRRCSCRPRSATWRWSTTPASAALDERGRATLVDELVEAIGELEEANVYPDGIEGLELAIYARDKQLAAMAEVREVADKLEKVVADDLWPLPKYSEMLFIK